MEMEMETVAESDPLLHRRSNSEQIAGAVDYRGRPVFRSSSGSWTAAFFIVGVEITERFAFYGISSNLITYLTGPLGESTASAAAAINTWNGFASLLPLLGAFLADSYLGRFRTIVLASILYILGLSMLTLSSVLPSILQSKCGDNMDAKACSPSAFQVALFFTSLYLVAFAQGGHKPCVQAFGADQFDKNDPKECIAKSSFFNWWYFAMIGGNTVLVGILNYIQDNVGWGLGFGIPCIALLLALMVFLLGTKTYRIYALEEESPFVRIGKSFVSLATHRRRSLPIVSEEEASGTLQSKPSDASHHSASVMENGRIDTMERIEEAKGVLRLFPIWATCLVYALVFAQPFSFFIKQASTMDRRIGSSFQIPSAWLQLFIGVTIVASIPVYDLVLVPLSRKLSGTPSGITMLQRIGTGMVVSLLSMVVAALVEMRRLQVARDSGLVDQPEATVPMSAWWMVPQYVLYGIADVFTMVGLQEFFYDQVPDAMRSLGLALYLSIFGAGNFVGALLISLIDKATKKGGESWFADNLNRAHLDYYYWLLAGLSALQVVVYLYFAQAYVYKRKESSGHVI